jgi:hypothetical protein
VLCRLFGNVAPNSTIIDGICEAVRQSLSLTSDVRCVLRLQKRVALEIFVVEAEMISFTSANAAWFASQSSSARSSLLTNIVGSVRASSGTEFTVLSVEIVIPPNFTPPPIASPAGEPTTDSGINSSSAQLPAIIGGAVGGAVALILIIVVIVVLVTRKRNPATSATPLPAVVPAQFPPPPGSPLLNMGGNAENPAKGSSSEEESSDGEEESYESEEDAEESDEDDSGDEESEQEDSEDESGQDESSEQSEENEDSESSEGSEASSSDGDHEESQSSEADSSSEGSE